MSLQKCHECGKDVSSEAKSCPNCGAAVEAMQSTPKQSNNIGCSTVVLGLLIFIVFISLVSYVSNYINKSEENAKRQKIEKEESDSKKNDFISSIDDNYKCLVRHYKSKNRESALSIIADFKKYKKMDYKDVAAIESKLSEPKYIKAVEKKLLRASKLSRQEESCYQLGFRYGRCVTMGLKGYKCDPADDIIVPVECRRKSETDRGIRDGVASVW